MKWSVRKAKYSRTPKPKSKYTSQVEASYISKGYSTKEAEIKAKGKIRTQKILAAIGTTAAVAVAAYVAKRGYDKRFTGVDLDIGATLKNINALGDKQVLDRRLYTSIYEGDTKKYRGLLGLALKRKAANSTVYEATLTATEKIKAPSHNTAAKIYKEFASKHGIRDDYKTFNQELVYDLDIGQKFYSHLKNKGYNALLDANDQFISGYNTKKPLILFNAASSTVKTGQRIVNDSEIKRNLVPYVAGSFAKSFAPYIGVGMAVYGGRKALDVKNRHGAVNKYILDHPETKMTYAEIYSKMERGDDQKYAYSS